MGSSHQRVRRLRRLVQKRSLRWSEGVCVLEGPDLVDAALDERRRVRGRLRRRRGPRDAGAARADREGRRVGRSGLRRGRGRRGEGGRRPDAAAGLGRRSLRSSATSTRLPATGLVLVLHDLRDPGNVGTIIRSADAAGATAVVVDRTIGGPLQPQDASRQRRVDLPPPRRGRARSMTRWRHFGATPRSSRRSCAAARSTATSTSRLRSVVVIGNEAERTRRRDDRPLRRGRSPFRWTDAASRSTPAWPRR